MLHVFFSFAHKQIPWHQQTIFINDRQAEEGLTPNVTELLSIHLKPYFCVEFSFSSSILLVEMKSL